MVYYAVETSKSGYTARTRMKSFGTLKEAEKYAAQKYVKGNAVVIDQVSRNSQHSVLQRGWRPEGGKKIHKQMAKDFGTWKYGYKPTMKKRVRRESMGFGLFG